MDGNGQYGLAGFYRLSSQNINSGLSYIFCIKIAPELVLFVNTPTLRKRNISGPAELP